MKAATKPISPPTISNILAVAAPSYGYGEYSREEIDANSPLGPRRFTGIVDDLKDDKQIERVLVDLRSLCRTVSEST